jgi:hypothetical protein
MLIVETIGRIRRVNFIKGKRIREIARDIRLSRNTVRKVLRSDETGKKVQAFSSIWIPLGQFSYLVSHIARQLGHPVFREL